MSEFITNVCSVLFSLTVIFLLTFLYSKSSRFVQKKIPAPLLFLSLAAKMIVSLLFCYIFAYSYEGGGDTFSYHKDASRIASYLLTDPSGFLEACLGGDKQWLLNKYYHSTIVPNYWNIPYGFNIIRITIPFEIIAFGNFFACSLWISFFAFTGMWKLFEMLCYYFNEDKKLLSIILFFPSVLFWTGGILKDTFIISAICWAVYCIFNLFVLKRVKFKYLLTFLLSIFIIVILKPYIVLVFIPCLAIWAVSELLHKVKNKLTRRLLAPVYLLITLLVVSILLFMLRNNLGSYGNYGEILNYSNEVRKGFSLNNSNDLIGIEEFDFGSLSSFTDGTLSTFSVIYRPFIWEYWNSFSFITGVENMMLLLLCTLSILLLLFDLKSITIFRKQPFLTFCLLYSLLFAVGIGLSIPNFGAILRFKSAFVLFYIIPFIMVISTVRKSLR